MRLLAAALLGTLRERTDVLEPDALACGDDGMGEDRDAAAATARGDAGMSKAKIRCENNNSSSDRHRLRTELQLGTTSPKRLRNKARPRAATAEHHTRRDELVGKSVVPHPPTTTQNRAHARKASAGEPRTCTARDRCDVQGRRAVAASAGTRITAPRCPAALQDAACSKANRAPKGLDSPCALGVPYSHRWFEAGRIADVDPRHFGLTKNLKPLQAT